MLQMMQAPKWRCFPQLYGIITAKAFQISMRWMHYVLMYIMHLSDVSRQSFVAETRCLRTRNLVHSQSTTCKSDRAFQQISEGQKVYSLDNSNTDAAPEMIMSLSVDSAGIVLMLKECVDGLGPKFWLPLTGSTPFVRTGTRFHYFLSLPGVLKTFAQIWSHPAEEGGGFLSDR